MKPKRFIRKLAFAAFWLTICGGMLTLLIAAMGKQRKDICRDYRISLKGPTQKFFMDAAQVESMVKKEAQGKITGRAKATLNLQSMEAMLEKNVWIKDAELYFDNRDVLHINITERQPVARAFTSTGKSFYIDETCAIMPLSNERTAKVPVFTGFVPKVISKRDTALVKDVRDIAMYILNDPFWMAQVGQVDITPDRHFEIYPVIGSHVIRIGDRENLDRKLHRLFVFYKHVLAKTGFEKYKAIDVQFAGQVIGVKYDATTRVDSTRLRKTVEKLLKEAVAIPSDDEMTKRAINEQRRLSADPELSATQAPGTVIKSPVE